MSGDRRWATVTGQRTILAVGRTVTSTLRVLDALAAVSGDPRVRVVFTVNDTSPFSDGVNRLLDDVGARVVPWPRAGRLPVDLVVTASENTELAGLDAPALVLPHGVGFQKVLPDSRGAGHRLSGVPRPEDVRAGRVVVAVSHPEQAAQLVAHAPYLAGMTAVFADPVHERLVASAWFRDRYRAALALGARRLVVLSSTWGRESLLGRWPDLPARLLAELPDDEYRAAVVLHPNIWSAHGAWQVRSWLARAREAGLLVMPPEGSWPALLVAADCVIADHGSVGMYAAAADRPMLLAPLGDETVAGTAVAMLGGTATRLDAGRPLREQVDAAMGAHQPGSHQAATAKAFATPPEAHTVRGVVYGLLGIPEPSHESPVTGYPVPEPERTRPQAFAVYTRHFAGGVEVRRIPAAVDTPAAVSGSEVSAGWWRHVAVGEGEWDVRMLHSATVVVARGSYGEDERDSARKLLERLPGATLVVAPTVEGAMVTVRDSGRIEVLDPSRRWDPMLLGAVVWTVVHAGTARADTIAVRVGGRQSPVDLRRHDVAR